MGPLMERVLSRRELKGLDYGLKVTYPGIEGKVVHIPVGESISALIEPDHGVIGRQFHPPMPPERALPLEFKVGQPIWSFDQRRSISYGRVADAHSVVGCAKPNLLVDH